MNYATQVRLNLIDQEIRRGCYPSPQALADLLEINVRTVFRDVKTLRDDFGAPVKFDSGKNGYYYNEPTWNLPAILFTEKELLALLIARNAITQFTGDPYGEHLRQAFEKIVKFLPRDEALNLGEIEEMYSFRFGKNRPVEPLTLDCISRAMKDSRTLKIIYHGASRGDITERGVDPYQLDNLQGEWYMIGFCHLRKEIRVFAVNRIKECYLLDKPFQPDPDFCYRDFIKNAFGIISTGKPEQIAVQFWGYEARLAREHKVHASQEIQEMPDDSVVIHLNVTGLQEVKRWVLSCGRDARVLEPEWFALEVKDEINEMQKRYNHSCH